MFNKKQNTIKMQLYKSTDFRKYLYAVVVVPQLSKLLTKIAFRAVIVLQFTTGNKYT